jgi:hypothetical protein
MTILETKPNLGGQTHNCNANKKQVHVVFTPLHQTFMTLERKVDVRKLFFTCDQMCEPETNMNIRL